MLTLPVTAPLAASLPRTGPAPTTARAPRTDSPARYLPPQRRKSAVVWAMVCSAAIHGVALFAMRPVKPAPRARPPQEAPRLALVMPQLKDLEEPEPVPAEEARTRPEVGSPAPLLADVPRIPLPTDFVQPMDLSSLVERPDLPEAKIYVIPEQLTRRGRGAGGEVDSIFNLADLDRQPEILFQPLPVFPPSQKAYVSSAHVFVVFIVGPEGRVSEASVTESNHSGFDAAAVAAVQQWRFRPGVKGGRKVSTRMSVPIDFRLVK